MRAFHLFVNPASGGGSAAAAGVPVARLLRDAGADVRLTYSTGEQTCRAQAAEAAARGEIVVAVGGDGMVGSVTGAVVRNGGTLGIVPAGRGNDFARQLGIPADAESVASLLLHAPVRSLDVIDADGRIVVGSVYAGIDSLSSELVNRAHRLPRSLQYPYAAVRALATYRPSTYRIEIDGIEHVEQAYTVVVANSGFYGSGMHVAPDAAVDDGLLSIVVIKAAARLRMLAAMRKLYDGSHVHLDEVRVLSGRAVRIDSAAGVTAYGDGERVAALPVTARVLPGALNVVG